MIAVIFLILIIFVLSKVNIAHELTTEDYSSLHEKRIRAGNNKSMENYRKAVTYYAEREENYVLHNEGDAHALVIFSTMFKYSKNKIRIVAKDMANEEVVNTKEYIEAMNLFLERSEAELQIILSDFKESVNDIPAERNFFKFLVRSEAYKDNRVHVKISKEKTFKLNGKPAHFCTSDGHAYRMEHDIDKRKAWCNFGSPETTSKMDELFDKAFKEVAEDFKLSEFVH